MNRLQRLLVAGAAVGLSLGPCLTSRATGQTTLPTTASEIVVESDDIRALVAPVALYPDPILALVLQSSTLPLQVVQADRFLAKRSKDPGVQPDPDWDKSIIGLLNYPRQVRSMAEYIDWTEELGNAVVDNLDKVQASVQDIRLAAYQAGFLKSNDRQKVEVTNGTVRITSTDSKKVSIPQYDPAALLTALDDIDEAEDAADEAAAAPATAPVQAKAAVAPAPLATAPSTPPEAPAVPAATGAGYAAPPTYATYPVTPPAIVYGEPQDSFWETAATFAGGAVVGGLLGWGLTEAFNDDDDDDDNHDHHDHHDEWEEWDQDQIQEELRHRRDFREERREDMVAARDERREDRREALGDRQEVRSDRGEERREDRAARARERLNEQPAARGGKVGPAAGNTFKAAAPAKADRGKHDVTLPGAGAQPGVTDKVRQRGTATQSTQTSAKSGATKLTSPAQKTVVANSGYAPRRSDRGIAAVTGNARQVREEADRGARSRQAAQVGQQTRATPSAFSPGDGSRGMAASSPRGNRAVSDGARGMASRGDGGRRGR